VGKKAVRNECQIVEPDVVHHLSNMVASKSPRDPIFTTHDGTPVKAADINIYLKQFGVDLSSKQFRTYAGSTMLIHLLNTHAHRGKKIELPESLSITERKHAINAALDIASSSIHNTRAVCKREYTHPDIVELYLNHPRKFASIFMRPGIDAERAFMEYMTKSSASTPDAHVSGGSDADEEEKHENPDEFWFS
jgi:hypothetical protein